MSELPNKKYGVIYVDPPWSYRRIVVSKGVASGGTASDHYNTMTLDELKQLNVKSLAEKDCCLFMWVACPKLDEAIALGAAWGFKYKTVAFVWEKHRPMVSHYTMSTCELCLVFKRGSFPKPRGTRNERQFLSQCRTNRHSEKPHEIRDRITRMFPENNKIELFARHNTEGWDTWGNDPAIT
jgi:N6-adenosine-specific RNA methylase IME4